DIDSDAKVSGSIIAPYAEVEIGEKAWFKGSISADEIVVKKRATFAPHDMFMPTVTKLGKSTGDIAAAIPGSYELAQNYPNPFNPTTTISYQLPENSAVKLQIYNTLGQIVATLVSGNQQAGSYTVSWDGTSQSGEKVASGVYVYRLQAGAFSQTRKMMLLK
ncbi:MAG: T9SS type A sorting domain-containing protein, partial [Calditrichaeota bacterium]|nr:T9SS type A sorting domain-containing protein [Calditrichota bacterium]